MEERRKLNFIYLLMAVLGLHCCMQVFSSCSDRGLLCNCSERASHCVGSLIAEHTLLSKVSVVVAHELCCSIACGIFQGKGSNLCPCIGRLILNHWTTKKKDTGESKKKVLDWVPAFQELQVRGSVS